MKIQFDEQSDALYLRLDNSTIIESEEVKPGIILDYNEHNKVVGVEILKLNNKVILADFKKVELEML